MAKPLNIQIPTKIKGLMGTRLTQKEIDAELKNEELKKAKKELHKRLDNKEKEVKK